MKYEEGGARGLGWEGGQIDPPPPLKKLPSESSVLPGLMLSSKAFQIFEIHFKSNYSFCDENILYSKLVEWSKFLKKTNVSNGELRMSLKVPLTFQIVSIFKTAQKYVYSGRTYK